jgi:hypothetical protein
MMVAADLMRRGYKIAFRQQSRARLPRNLRLPRN